ncbi:renalase-like [Plakobranchus ocellatus]|uniref:Renalase-like n=1 Tax=Plakobranchus ocellatus TaxID=259542 RepID=A0AAV4BJ00_9GAST|nr:renalase-like [Plakobranchus ocellatus]
MAKVLVVGAGMTGAASAALLKQHIPEIASITIWDKGRGAGGRMSTARCPEDSSISADLGAQYITLKQEYRSRRQSLYDELLQQGVLSPMRGKVEGPNSFDEPGAQHFVTPSGVSSLVKYFINKSGAEAKYQHTVSDVTFGSDESIHVTTQENIAGDFDIVILTMPVPQILQMKGSIHDLIGSDTDIKSNLQRVMYSSRYALAMFFSPQTTLPLTWSARYLENDPCIRYMAVDQAKRGLENVNSGWSMVVHSGVPFGLSHLEDNMESVKATVLDRVREVLPELPEPLSAKIQRWRYSQVHQGYEGSPGCIVLNKKPLVILTGDAFSHSTFDGCLDSAEAVLRTLQEQMQSQKHTGPSSGL